MHHPNDALATARIGYKIAYENEDSNVGVLAETILQAKKEKWAVMEKSRIWALNETLHQLEVMVEKQKAANLDEIEQKFKEGTLGIVGREEEQQATEAEHKETIAILRENFAKDNPDLKERVSNILLLLMKLILERSSLNTWLITSPLPSCKTQSSLVLVAPMNGQH